MRLSVLIPACNEIHLAKTVESLLQNSCGDIEILVALDNWTIDLPELPPSKMVKVIETELGQRGATNELARMSTGTYLMKTDAHCSFGYGFDTKMIKDIQPKTILAPYMFVLDEESWTPRNDKRSSQYVFGTNMVMEYGTERPEILTDSMCLQGSCFMLHVDDYFDWNICDESLGGWGGQAVELGIKAYLMGGKCMTTKNTYYAHLFRTKDEDFPYQRGDDPGKHANVMLIRKYRNAGIKGLIERYNYPCDWSVDSVDSVLGTVDAII